MMHIVKNLRMLALAIAIPAAASSAEAQRSADWNWTGTLAEGRTVFLHNVNGEVRFETGTGNTVEVRAVKRWRRGDPDDVRIEARQAGSGDGNIVICAFWNERATCDEDGYRGSNNDRKWNGRDNDVSVEFTVRVPSYARVEANTVNGSIRIAEVAGSVRARTVNGGIEARSTKGHVVANTVNGSITVSGHVDASGVEYTTVNGSITIELPANANANVDLSTVNGRIATEFPITFDGTIDPRRIRAAIGAGGPTLRARTTNGSVRLKKM
jgi:hypothetical protein